MKQTYAETVATIRELRKQWTRSANAYCAEPFAGTRAFNDSDQARERMRASRAAKKEQQ